MATSSSTSSQLMDGFVGYVSDCYRCHVFIMQVFDRFGYAGSDGKGQTTEALHLDGESFPVGKPFVSLVRLAW